MVNFHSHVNVTRFVTYPRPLRGNDNPGLKRQLLSRFFTANFRRHFRTRFFALGSGGRWAAMVKLLVCNDGGSFHALWWRQLYVDNLWDVYHKIVIIYYAYHIIPVTWWTNVVTNYMAIPGENLLGMVMWNQDIRYLQVLRLNNLRWNPRARVQLNDFGWTVDLLLKNWLLVTESSADPNWQRPSNHSP